MILFAGEQEKGYFVPEIAQKYNDQCDFSGFVSDIDELTNLILKSNSYNTVILHLPSLFVLDYKNINTFCRNINIANSKIRIIIMAEGYNISSRIVQAAIASGVRYFMLGTNATQLKNELNDALLGKTNIDEVFDSLPTEDLKDKKKEEIAEFFPQTKTIAFVGVMERMGTTTQAIQLVKYLLLEGYKACYIQMNHSGYVELLGEIYTDATVNEDIGKVSFQNVDMYYKQEKIPEVLKQNYQFYIYDFGYISSRDFTLVSYLEKDIRIAVCGSKPNEIPAFIGFLDNCGDSATEFVYNFTSESEQSDILEMMEERKKHTYFTGYVPDPFSYNPSTKKIYDDIILTDKAPAKPEPEKKYGLFGRRKKRKDK